MLERRDQVISLEDAGAYREWHRQSLRTCDMLARLAALEVSHRAGRISSDCLLYTIPMRWFTIVSRKP